MCDCDDEQHGLDLADQRIAGHGEGQEYVLNELGIKPSELEWAREVLGKARRPRVPWLKILALMWLVVMLGAVAIDSVRLALR